MYNNIKSYTYSLVLDIFLNFSNQELLALMNTADLMKNIISPSVCGSFLFNTINRYQKTRNNISVN